MNDKNILIVDPICAKGHIELNKKILELINKTSNTHTLTIDDYSLNNKTWIFKKYKNKLLNKFLYRVKNYYFNKYVIKYFKENNFDIICFIAYETVSISLALFNQNKTSQKTWLYEHNNIDDANSNIVKKFFYNMINKHCKHIVFEEYIMDSSKKEMVSIPHPIYERLINNKSKKKDYLFSPSGGNDNLLTKKLISFCENNFINLIIKNKQEIKTKYITSSIYFNNYNELITEASSILLLNRFEDRASGVMYEALTAGTNIIAVDCKFSRELNLKYPNLVSILFNIEDLSKIVINDTNDNSDYINFLNEHSDENIVKIYNDLINSTMKKNMKKKILISINTSWNTINFRLGLLKAIQKKGYDIVVLAPKDKYSELFKEHDFQYYDIEMNNKGTNPIEDFKLIINYYKLLKEIKPDLILNYTIKPNIYGTIAASFLKIPTINNIAGLGTLFIKENFVTKIAKYLYKFSQAKAKHIFFQNNEDYELFISQNLVDKNKCGILPGSGVDTSKFIPLSNDKKDNTFKFLLISRMLWDKGIQEYVDAAREIKKKYPNVEFQLLGFLDVSNKSAIGKEQMDIWVKEGVVNYLGISDNVKNEISKCDCIVLPSFYREGTPRTLLESASMAKPIITTDNIGCRDVVDDKINGYLCEIRNSKDLSEKIELMINLSENERIGMGNKGREKIINEFDESIVIHKYLEVIEKIL